MAARSGNCSAGARLAPNTGVMLTWTEELATGNPQIDEEHREIYRQLNLLSEEISRGADDATLKRLTEVLMDYAHLHFHHEEHAMACAKCPKERANCNAHRHFIERLRIWMALMTSTRLPRSMIASLHQETKIWIRNHIEKIDSGLRQATSDAAANTSAPPFAAGSTAPFIPGSTAPFTDSSIPPFAAGNVSASSARSA